MKQISILSILMCLFSILSIESFSQTTMEEYLYLTKGYKIQVESGLDIKSGYEIKDITQATTTTQDTGGNRNAVLKALYRIDGGQRKIAAYLIVYQLSNNTKDYICVPSPYSGKEVTQAFFDSLYDGNPKVNSSYKLQTIALLLARGLKW